MDQALWLRAVWRYRVFAALIFALVLIATFVYLLITPKSYQSVSFIAGSSFSVGVTVDVDRVLPTLAQLATSDEVRSAARRTVPGPVPGQIAANPLQNTLLLQVAVTGPDPARVARYSNAVSQQLINRNPLPSFVRLSLVQAAVPEPRTASPSAKVVLPLGALVGVALAVVGANGRNRLHEYRVSSTAAAHPVRTLSRHPSGRSVTMTGGTITQSQSGQPRTNGPLSRGLLATEPGEAPASRED